MNTLARQAARPKPADALARQPAPPLAVQALDLLAVAPALLGGARLRGPSGPEREAWLQALAARLPAGTPWCRLPPGASEEALDGGLDLVASLSQGRPVRQAGLLERAAGGLLLLPMAERLSRARAARLALALDGAHGQSERWTQGLAEKHSPGLALVALDEAVQADEGLAPALADRLAFDLRPQGMPPAPDKLRLARARRSWPQIAGAQPLLATLAQAAQALGIESTRAVWLAWCTARVAAALRGAAAIEEADLTLAAQLVLAPRARQLPTSEAAEPAPAEPASNASPEPTPPQPAEGDDTRPREQPQAPADETDRPLDREEAETLQDRVLASTQAAIPPGLLALLGLGSLRPTRRGDAGRQGRAAASAQRGRPLGAQAGLPRGGQRLALIETLRAAAPWQTMRRAAAEAASGVPGPAGRVIVQRDDLRVQRRQERRGTTTIFAIDASGSQAMHRLAEAKGAVELLLAECYARRDRVAVIGFRGTGAQLLLPPTRSLVMARRRLAGLPGGGGTPLACGIEAATALAASVQQAGSTPLVVLLTDGKANVGRSGDPGRPQAMADAERAARALAASGTAALVIDTSPQPGAAAQQLAQALGARWLALPHAGSRALSGAVQQVRGQSHAG
ncbi:MAG: magnesium chelatase subunit D [Rubrivivax sp.]|nr:magnesium chelatase subunit D [Rubrivivax sp.]